MTGCVEGSEGDGGGDWQEPRLRDLYLISKT